MCLFPKCWLGTNSGPDMVPGAKDLMGSKAYSEVCFLPWAMDSRPVCYMVSCA